MFRILLALFFINVSFAQQIDKVDFISCEALLFPDASNQSISGNVTYIFEIENEIDSIKIDAKNMEFFAVYLNDSNNNQLKYTHTNTHLILHDGLKKGLNAVKLKYSAKPKQTLYFTGKDESLQIWTQGQGRYTSHWLPSFDDVNEKIIFKISVYFDNKFHVLSNGNLVNRVAPVKSDEKKILWEYEMQKPMSSYLVMLAIGNFAKQTSTTKSGTPLEFYLDKNDVAKFEPTYRYSKELFDYLEQEIGVKYPWGIYRQVPVRDFLYAGMENTTSTIFAQDFVVDSIGFNDRNYVNVNAHELAHQWFGDLITAQSGKHHWLQEGFATYYALLAEQHIFTYAGLALARPLEAFVGSLPVAGCEIF